MLDYTILETGTLVVTVRQIVSVAAILTGSWLMLLLFRKFILRSRRIREGKRYALYQIFKYFTLFGALVLGIDTVGISLTVLLAGSAALLVGVGLGLQNLFNDFVSGVIILVDGSIKVDDVIEVNALVARVQAINLRTTTVLTRDDKYIILPNSVLTGSPVINWTHSTITSRFDIAVGVAYDSDVRRVMEVMRSAAVNHPGLRTDPAPFVRLVEFADSALQFQLVFWTDEVFRVENIKSEIRIAIVEGFRQHGIVIPFPQRTLHMAGGTR